LPQLKPVQSLEQVPPKKEEPKPDPMMVEPEKLYPKSEGNYVPQLKPVQSLEQVAPKKEEHIIEKEAPKPKPNPSSTFIYAKHLKAMEEMGFINQKRNIELLLKFKGNLDEIVPYILDAGY